MAMRRPRIKPTANFRNIKRKKTVDQEEAQTNNKICENKSVEDNYDELKKQKSFKANNSEISQISAEEGSPEIIQISNKDLEENKDNKDFITSKGPDDEIESQEENIETENITTENTSSNSKIKSESHSFKCPPKVEHNSVNVPFSDDVFQSDLDSNVIQMDLQKSANGFPMSPSKLQSRQRIRPTPIFGQRRNSFVASSPSPHTPEDSAPSEFVAPMQRRERHFSASLSQNSNMPSTYHHHTTHKFTPTMSSGRVRTESSCSAFSDSFAASGKTRKVDDYMHRNHTRRDFESRFSRGIPDKSALKMFDLIYYNPVTNPMEQKTGVSNVKQESAQDIEKSVDNAQLEKRAEAEAAVVAVPQLKLNSNGELILDDKSLEIETTAEQEARKVLANSSLIFLDENTGMNGFYKRQKRTKEWFPEETIKFYRCLQTVGTDFSLMCQLFPKRTRRDLKLKFKREERCNGALINKALLYPKNFNIEELKEQLKAEDQEREETFRKWKDIKAADVNLSKSKLKAKASSNAARALQNGDQIYQNEHVLKQKFSKRNKKSEPLKSVEGSDKRQILQKKPQSRVKKTDIQQKKVQSNAHIKVEHIKSEKNPAETHIDSTTGWSTTPAPVIDATQLQNELSELLHSDAAQSQQLSGSATPRSKEYITPNTVSEQAERFNEPSTHNISMVNLDDGSVSYVIEQNTATLPRDAPQPVTVKARPHVLSYLGRDLNEADIQRILTDLTEGSLVLVSTLDPDNVDKVLNEIYMVNKETGDLYEEPLDLPEVIVQGILSVIN